MARIIDGKAIAATIRDELKAQVEVLKTETGGQPGLAVVLVGARKDSQTYVRMKKRAAAEVGIASFESSFPETVTQDELLAEVQRLNSDPLVHGILVQLPLPKHIDEEEILAAISLDKDVDGFHPLNIGRLCMKRRAPLFVPCTPLGCIELLDREGFAIEGKNAVVLGRSNIVGLPVAMLLNHRNATVQICHSKSKDLADKIRQADILIAACGQAEIVRGDWIKPGAVVIDVGTNPVDIPEAQRTEGGPTYRLVGDVNFEEVKQVAAAVTPVPGGVGPMTIAELLKNTVESAKRHLKGASSSQ